MKLQNLIHIKLALAAITLALCACADTTTTAAPHKKQPSADASARPEYNVAVESEPAGAVIEVNGDYRGRTPCVISVVGTWAGTVPWPGLTVKAIPTRPGDSVQINSFTSGGDLPKRLYFNMTLGPAPQEIDVQIQ